MILRKICNGISPKGFSLKPGTGLQVVEFYFELWDQIEIIHIYSFLRKIMARQLIRFLTHNRFRELFGYSELDSIRLFSGLQQILKTIVPTLNWTFIGKSWKNHPEIFPKLQFSGLWHRRIYPFIKLTIYESINNQFCT